ncbi:MAG TPA: hypothetical protein VFY17_03345 [Pilimelia sp.]|nr:hypothetical protein [Pilimelia sp.]
MRLLRLILPVLAALAWATPATAVPYPAEPPPATVSTSTIGAGGTLTFSASGFIAGESVSVSVSYEPAGAAPLGMRLVAGESYGVTTATADGSGAIAVPVTLTTPGVATITATGLRSGVTVSTTVTVTGSTAAGLPVTGGMPGGLLRELLLAGAGLTLVGAWLVAWMVRRRRTDATAG